METKLECLEYFIRHKAIFTECILTKIGMEQNATCKVCKDEDEGILHLFLYCKELEGFYRKCKKMIKGLIEDWDEEVIEWKRIVMFGWEENCQSKKFVNLLIMLIKNAVWERRNVAKKGKVVLDVWNVLKRKTERYIEGLYLYFKYENMLQSFYVVFTPRVSKVLKDLAWNVPGSDLFF